MGTIEIMHDSCYTLFQCWGTIQIILDSVRVVGQAVVSEMKDKFTRKVNLEAPQLVGLMAAQAQPPTPGCAPAVHLGEVVNVYSKVEHRWRRYEMGTTVQLPYALPKTHRKRREQLHQSAAG